MDKSARDELFVLQKQNRVHAVGSQTLSSCRRSMHYFNKFGRDWASQCMQDEFNKAKSTLTVFSMNDQQLYERDWDINGIVDFIMFKMYV